MASFSLFPQKSRPDEVVEHAFDIGADPPDSHKRSAMRVSLVSDSLSYIEEVPIEVGWTPYNREYHSEHYADWTRFECKVLRHETIIRPGHQLVVARMPYSSGIVDIPTFKAPWKKKNDKRPHPPKTITTADEFIRWTEERTFDYWETGTKLTAGFSTPNNLNLRDSQAYNEFATPRVYGLCEDATAYVKRLIHTDEAIELLRTTEQNTIRFWSPKAKLNFTPKLYPAVIAKSLQLLELSMYQALAGPERNSEEWFGRPVMHKVDELYRDHLNDHNRRLQPE